MSELDYRRIEKAIKYYCSNIETQPQLKDLAKFLDLSEFHCHRLFKKWTGITPKDFLKALTIVRAKSLLINSSNVLDASHLCGLSGASRLYDLFVTMEGMTPGEYKRLGEGVEIYWEHFDSPLGKMNIAKTKRGICLLEFSKKKPDIGEWKKKWPGANILRDSKSCEKDVKAICSHMMGKKSGKTHLFVTGTDFQVKVWQALLSIPEGKISSYGEIASSIGRPNAVRAVGTAIGKNPIAYLIPCHRVIRSTGVIGDYHWGSDRKKMLITIERARS